MTLNIPLKPLDRWINTNLTEISDAASVTVDDYGCGLFADSRYSVSLARGALGVYAHAVNTACQPAWAADPYAAASFSDEVCFIIPPGDYPNGVEVRFTGMLQGTLDVVGEDTYHEAILSASAMVGGVWFNKALHIAGGNSNCIVIEPWVVTNVLVPPGTTVTAPRSERRGLQASLTTEAAAGGMDHSGHATCDFEGGLRFLPPVVPPGVTWTSDSGVFLNAVTLPEPVTFIPCELDNGVLRLRFVGLPEQSYTVLFTDALTAPSPGPRPKDLEWHTLTNLTGAGQMVTIEVAPSLSGNRFFQVRSD